MGDALKQASRVPNRIHRIGDKNPSLPVWNAYPRGNIGSKPPLLYAVLYTIS
jgi:hypothetical protein